MYLCLRLESSSLTVTGDVNRLILGAGNALWIAVTSSSTFENVDLISQLPKKQSNKQSLVSVVLKSVFVFQMYTYWTFLVVLLDSLWQSAVIYFLPHLVGTHTHTHTHTCLLYTSDAADDC